MSLERERSEQVIAIIPGQGGYWAEPDLYIVHRLGERCFELRKGFNFAFDDCTAITRNEAQQIIVALEKIEDEKFRNDEEHHFLIEREGCPVLGVNFQVNAQGIGTFHLEMYCRGEYVQDFALGRGSHIDLIDALRKSAPTTQTQSDQESIRNLKFWRNASALAFFSILFSTLLDLRGLQSHVELALIALLVLGVTWAALNKYIQGKKVSSYEEQIAKYEKQVRSMRVYADYKYKELAAGRAAS